MECGMKKNSVVGIVFFVLAVAATLGAGQDSASAPKAAVITKLLDEQKLDAIAAQDPEQPDRFVAALYYPGAQLLAVSAAHPSPQFMRDRIANRQYRDVYMDLQGPATQNGRLFVMDLAADGLHDRPYGDGFDITYQSGANQVSFDGNWKDKKMSRAQYEQRFKADDERYAQMLAALERELTRGDRPGRPTQLRVR
jgi:hypothetical protein